MQFIEGPEGPIRDLTSGYLNNRTGRSVQERASVYRDARDAYAVGMENTALGYKSEEKDYRAANPAPSWKQFLQHG
jgi:hypothetical protein